MSKYISAKCKNNHTFNVPWSREYAGRTIQKKCPKCNELIIAKIPKSLSNGYTVVPKKKDKKAYGAKLIIHESEYNQEQVFVISGKNNIVGRKNSTKKPNIEIDTIDMRLSRLHFIIRVYKDKEENSFRYTLLSPYKTNDILLNDNLLTLDDEIYLSDNDTIKTGMSTFTFKTLNS